VQTINTEALQHNYIHSRNNDIHHSTNAQKRKY